MAAPRHQTLRAGARTSFTGPRTIGVAPFAPGSRYPSRHDAARAEPRAQFRCRARRRHRARPAASSSSCRPTTPPGRSSGPTRDIPHELVDRIILVDDVSSDETVEIARQLGLDVIIHRQNRGYGGNQKTCYDAALEAGADVVVMLHPDYQYDATRIPALVEPILARRRAT